MKNLPFAILLLLSLLSCGNHKTHNIDSLYQYRDTLIGRFYDIEIDTLIAEPIDTTKERAMWDWRIYSKCNSVDTLILTHRFSVKMTSEGDLDGNGADEFGVRRETDAGTWDNYYIYTFDNGEWKYLTEPIWTYSTHFYDDLNNGNDVAERTNKAGHLKIRFSDLRNDDICIVDTLLPIALKEITNYKVAFGD